MPGDRLCTGQLCFAPKGLRSAFLHSRPTPSTKPRPSTMGNPLKMFAPPPDATGVGFGIIVTVFAAFGGASCLAVARTSLLTLSSQASSSMSLRMSAYASLC